MIVELLIAGAALGGGYGWTKGFVQRRLRFVDAAHTRAAPWIAGVVAGGVGALFTPLPLITGLTAACLGVGVGLGVKSAQRDRLLPPGDD